LAVVALILRQEGLPHPLPGEMQVLIFVGQSLEIGITSFSLEISPGVPVLARQAEKQ